MNVDISVALIAALASLAGAWYARGGRAALARRRLLEEIQIRDATRDPVLADHLNRELEIRLTLYVDRSTSDRYNDSTRQVVALTAFSLGLWAIALLVVQFLGEVPDSVALILVLFAVLMLIGGAFGLGDLLSRAFVFGQLRSRDRDADAARERLQKRKKARTQAEKQE